ncbi:MAG TPA: glycosyltransferase family 39 protein [Rubrivivax sp.]|nr:glycosyltransferase family 39 protein [Rubrivivax sp.]
MLSPRQWLLVLLIYLGAQVLVRLWAGQALERDESEQVLWAQQLALGYGAQPPLYTWLQRAVFEILGVSVLGLTLLKHGLLALTYLFTFAAARMLMPAALAALAAASLLLLPQISVDSHRDLTHVVLCTTVAAATVWAVLALRQRPTRWRYAALGLAVGLGMLSKYSYTIVALALLLALAAAADTRALLRQRGMVLTIAVAALVVAPHALWLLSNLPQATGGTLAKMGATSGLPWNEKLRLGLVGLVVAAIWFLTPLSIVLAALFVRGRSREGGAPGPACGLMRRYLGAIAALLLALVLAGALTQVKGRWLQPFLVAAPLAFFACAPQLRHHPRLPALQRVLLVWAVLLVALMVVRMPFNGWRGRTEVMHVPVRALAQALRDAGYDGRPIVTPSRTLGGALRVQFAPAQVVVVGLGGEALPDTALWIGPGEGPAALAAIEGATGQPTAAARSIALPAVHAPASAAPLHFTFSLQP